MVLTGNANVSREMYSRDKETETAINQALQIRNKCNSKAKKKNSLFLAEANTNVSDEMYGKDNQLKQLKIINEQTHYTSNYITLSKKG